MSARSQTSGAPAWSGVGYALAAFGLWGGFPLYFKAVASVPAPEVLGHRVVWSVVWVALLLTWVGQWSTVRALLTAPRRRLMLLASSLLIATNWLIFIWAVAHGRVLAASLGYYITPLVSVLLGRIVLGERLQPLQWVAVALAALGVSASLIGFGALPWVSLGLALTFGSYGLVRKIADVDAIPGLFVETLLLAPVALAFLAWLESAGTGAFASAGIGLSLLLAAAGLVTAAPLILFAQATRRLRLASVGLLQYLVPTLQMLLAVFAFGEAFTPTHGVTFGCIWVALALYSASVLRGHGREPAHASESGPRRAAPLGAPAERLHIRRALAGALITGEDEPMSRVEQFEKMLANGHDGALLRFSLGNEYLSAEDPAQAGEHLRRAVEHDPEYSAAWNALATALQRQGDTAGAMSAYREGIAAAQTRGDKQLAQKMGVYLRRLEKQQS